MDSTTINIIIHLAILAKESEGHKSNADMYREWYHEEKNKKNQLQEKVWELENQVKILKNEV